MLKLFIIAGEASGDIIGANLLKAFKRQGIEIQTLGIGGTRMIEAGFNSITDIKKLSVMGFIEVIPRILDIISVKKMAIMEAQHFHPDVVITIDSLGFNSRIVRELRQKLDKKTKFIHYVAPAVWFYKPKRVQIIQELFDHLLLILPFEAQYFENIVPYTFVGHPIFEQPMPKHFAGSQVDQNAPGIILMPGSRKNEINKLLPLFRDTIINLDKKFKYYIPVLESFAAEVDECFADIGIDYQIITDAEDRELAIAKSSMALIKSGTSSVELMPYLMPMIVTYKMNWITEFYLRLQMKSPYISLANIVSNELVIPEFTGRKCYPALLIHHIEQILAWQENDRNQYNDRIMKALALLKSGIEKDAKPSDLAVKAIKKTLTQ